MPHMRYTVQLGARGRFVLPAPLRRELGLEEGTHLLLELEDGSVRVVKARDVAEGARGILQDGSGRSLVDELLAERREEAEREAGALSFR